MSVPFDEIGAVVIAVMITTFEALLVFLLFLPGFVSQRIIEVLSPRKERDWFGRLVSGAVLSLVIYAFYVACIALPTGLPRLPVEVVVSEEIAGDLSVSPLGFGRINYQTAGIILALSIVLGLIIGRSMDAGSFFGFLRADYIPIPRPDDTGLRARVWRVLRRVLRFTTATGRDTLWEDALCVRRSHFVKVTLRSGRVIIGRYLHYSDNPRTRELWIISPEQSLLPEQPPAVLVAEAGSSDYKPIPGSGVLITAAAEIETVEFLGGMSVESGHGKGKRITRRTNKAGWRKKSRRSNQEAP